MRTRVSYTGRRGGTYAGARGDGHRPRGRRRDGDRRAGDGRKVDDYTTAPTTHVNQTATYQKSMPRGQREEERTAVLEGILADLEGILAVLLRDAARAALGVLLVSAARACPQTEGKRRSTDGRSAHVQSVVGANAPSPSRGSDSSSSAPSRSKRASSLSAPQLCAPAPPLRRPVSRPLRASERSLRSARGDTARSVRVMLGRLSLE